MSDKACPTCRRSNVGPIHIWRRRTMYVANHLNFLTCCYHCITEDDHQKHYDWAEYRSSSGYGVMIDEFVPRDRRNHE